MQFLYSHLKQLEQQQRDRLNPCMRKQLTKIRAEINELQTRSTVEQINRTRSWFFERINKIDHWQDLSKRIEKSEMQFLYSHLMKLEHQQRDRPNSLMRKQLTKIRAEINEFENRSTVKHSNRTRIWLFERINRIDRPLATLTQKQRERTQINKNMNEKGEVMANTYEIGRIIRNFYKQLFANKLSNLEEMEAFLETYKLPRLKTERSRPAPLKLQG